MKIKRKKDFLKYCRSGSDFKLPSAEESRKRRFQIAEYIKNMKVKLTRYMWINKSK